MLQYKFRMRETGFSLVELMVGLVIGLLATLVIMQVFSVFEGQKRSTTGTADAQTNGTIALMQLQRHLQTAGYGMPMPMADLTNNILRCTSTAGTNAFPVVIDDGASGNAGDRIISRYSTTAAGGGVPITILNASNATTGDGMVVQNNIGCGNDLEMTQVQYNATYQDLTDTTAERNSQPPNTLMVISNNQCATAQIAKQPTNTGGVSQIRLMAVPADMPTLGLPGAEDKLACMGGYADYSLDIDATTNELRLNGDPVTSEVISMQAQYGVSNTANLNTVTAWVEPTGTWAAPITNIANRNRIKAIRVAIVLRNGLKEKTQVTPNSNLTWTGSDGTTMTLSVAHLPDWGNYRYRVFGTTVPLRNMLWSKEAVQ